MRSIVLLISEGLKLILYLSVKNPQAVLKVFEKAKDFIILLDIVFHIFKVLKAIKDFGDEIIEHLCIQDGIRLL